MAASLSTLIALRQLTGQPFRLAAGLTGVVAAFLLMSVQLGVRDALYESAVRLHRNLNADLVVTSPVFVSLTNMPRFSDSYVFRAAGTPGVASAVPFYADAVPWRNPLTGIPRLINVYGLAPGTPAFALPEVTAMSARLSDPEVVLFDRLSRAEFGPIVREVEAGRTPVVGLSLDQRFPGDRMIRVEGLFSLGPSFVIDGDIIASDRGFHRITGVSLDRVTFGLIRLAPGLVARDQAARLQQRLGPGVRVMTKADFIQFEKRYWSEQTSIGFVFELGLVIGFLVGAVFVYQVLFIVIQENMREYGVLKSLGHGPAFLYGIILQAALLVGLAALVPGLPLAVLVTSLARSATGLPILLDGAAMAWLSIATLGMAMLAGAVAGRRLREADIIELFA